MTNPRAKVYLADMRLKLPAPMNVPAELAVLLMETAIKAIRSSAGPARKRPRKGQTLRPGPDSPLWNALSSAARAQCKARGDRVKVGRILGLPRQRITEMLRSRKHLPDAERTLMLLVWLHARAHGREFG